MTWGAIVTPVCCESCLAMALTEWLGTVLSPLVDDDLDRHQQSATKLVEVRTLYVRVQNPKNSQSGPV